ncbi:Uncharacterised protein [Mycolicibacterium phlei]|uniref:hypothetical protein n=1 Tax=Mycolicibacterium phlei TaxID=1771 RepID=UPI00058C7303|nr:hypothetical protein [Mycolicibacterium phlei]AMO61205.1 hypothetical protein MPHLCCUG_02392 [Mycolicibacterium phlei]KXW76397.1 hypothetical protein JL15_17185 [Mycolicibacterium phlei DSM 43071]STZ18108.1 Uncharacterised protein [Mycolicibacterium phlei]VEG09320.1 Uncharacterised protein [Mycobacteroides chelonae]
MRAETVVPAVIVALLAAGCSGERIVHTSDEPPPPLPTTTTPAAPPAPPREQLVDASGYVARPNGSAVYAFSSPSGRWVCTIVPRDRVGCQSASRGSGLGISGQPTAVPNAEGTPTAPNAIVVDHEGEPRFVALETPEFVVDDAPELPFGKVLVVAGFRCNVQEESGISCRSDRSGSGFTFAADGFEPRYTELPPP